MNRINHGIKETPWTGEVSYSGARRHTAAGQSQYLRRVGRWFKTDRRCLALAGKDGKRVLLQFGANWCPWCHKLHSLFDTDKDIAALT
jgi:uncharacterized protein YyaL (SSP411 family)